MKLLYRVFTVLCFLTIGHSVYCNNPIYEQRRTDYIDSSLAHFTRDAITIQAYKGMPVDTAALNALVGGITNGTTSDFDIVKLIRVLFYTNGQYDAQILPVLNSVPYWLTKNEVKRTYWSENHMIMWMSSDWLLHEKYGRAIDSTLDKRLRHFLKLKVEYGFYEFFSSVYAPYSLSGLLNLADFSQDVEIKTLATQAAQRLLKDLLMLTNDKGVFYPVAGRNYYGKYDGNGAYGQNHNHLIYLLTGFGPRPNGTSHAAGFLASSTLPVDDIINSWVANLDTTYYIGHPLDSLASIHADMSHIDRLIFQWSAGVYFHPDYAYETAKCWTDSNLWNHVDFTSFNALKYVTLSTVTSMATSLSMISKSSVNVGQEAVIFKHKSITLASLKDFWKGKIGFQQIPVVANVGTTAVLTASGPIKKDWSDRNENSDNDHLPYVAQKKNVALIMYRPEPVPELLPYHNPEVALHWTDADFDEVQSDSMWLLGRQGTGYVAVRRHCIGEIDSVRACNFTDGQTWVIMVGDSDMYGSFSNFKSIIHQAQFQEKWYMDTLNNQLVYYAKISVDTFNIEYAWGVDTTTASGIKNTGAERTLGVFPNPISDKLVIDLAPFLNQPVTIQVTNLLGRQIYLEHRDNLADNQRALNTQNWPQGVYVVSVQTAESRFSKKIVKR